MHYENVEPVPVIVDRSRYRAAADVCGRWCIRPAMVTWSIIFAAWVGIRVMEELIPFSLNTHVSVTVKVA